MKKLLLGLALGVVLFIQNVSPSFAAAPEGFCPQEYQKNGVKWTIFKTEWKASKSQAFKGGNCDATSEYDYIYRIQGFNDASSNEAMSWICYQRWPRARKVVNKYYMNKLGDDPKARVVIQARMLIPQEKDWDGDGFRNDKEGDPAYVYEPNWFRNLGFCY